MSWQPLGWALIALLTLVAPCAAAQDGARTLESLLSELRSESPTLAAARSRAGAARALASAAGRPEDPMAEVELDNLGLTEEDDRMMARYALQQSIPTIGTLRLQKRVASAMVQQAERGAEGASLDVMREGARAFVMLRMAQGELLINERQQRLVQLVGEAALSRMRSGGDTHHDVLQSQAELLSLRNQHTVLEARLVEGRAMINALRNQPPDAPFVAGEAWTASVPPLASEKLEQAALERRPELGQMRAMQGEQNAMAALMRREARPMFRVGAWYNDMLMMGDSVGFMVSASLPVFGVPRQRALAESARRTAEAVAHEAVAMADDPRAGTHVPRSL